MTKEQEDALLNEPQPAQGYAEEHLRLQLSKMRKSRDDYMEDARQMQECILEGRGQLEVAEAAREAAEKQFQKAAEWNKLTSLEIENLRSLNAGLEEDLHNFRTLLLELCEKMEAGISGAEETKRARAMLGNSPAGGVTISNDSAGISTRPLRRAGDTSDGSRAGAVTISTEKKGGEAGMFIESPPMKGASDVRPEGRPADVPSEGRGEWMPFNLPDALAGKPVVSRNGFPCEVRALTNNTTDYVAMATVDGWEFQILPNGQLYSNRESPLDCFMLPTEGSGA